MQAYELLEKRLEEWTGCDNVVVCSSGTSALHIGLEALQVPIPSKHNVIVPDYSMIACARSVSLASMKPIVVDCHSDNLLMDVELAEEAIRKYTIAMMPVHNYGRLCDMQSINDVADKHGLFVIEDMAEAHGCYPHPNTQIACWSFYRNKVVRGEEGGAVSFKSAEMAKIARQIRNMGFGEYHDYSHRPRGCNYRMPNVCAELILTSLSRFPETLAKRREIEGWYQEDCPIEWRMPERASPWVYDLRIPWNNEVRQKHMIDVLREQGIQARHGFKPISSQDEYKGVASSYHKERDVSLSASRELLYLPIEPDTTTKDDVRKAMDILKNLAEMPTHPVVSRGE